MLQSLGDGWYSFGGGRRWRCTTPGGYCEVDEPGNCPSLANEPGIRAKIARIRSIYQGKLSLGTLDLNGTGLDILIANSLTESYGTVPSPLDRTSLEKRLSAHPEQPLAQRLDLLIRELGAARESRFLVRKEPGYTNPVSTPAKVSVGAHHMLIETAQALATQKRNGTGTVAVATQMVRLASESLHSASLAIEYLNKNYHRHLGHPPLIAATYNAGSPKWTQANSWHLVQYGKHIDRWISYYNASREAAGAAKPTIRRTEAPVPVVVASAAPLGAPPPSTQSNHLSAHFSLAEMIESPTARARKINNNPPTDVMQNLARLAELLEMVRHLLGDRSLHINSAYRSPELNKAVGSKSTSRHLHGLAADFTCTDFGTPLQICEAIAKSPIVFDQLIHEFGTWVHVGLAPSESQPRKQSLTIDSQGTRAGLHPIR